MYRPGFGFPENTGMEYVELHNTDPVSVDVSGWALTDGATYTFPAGTIIAANGFLVVGGNPTAIQNTYGVPQCHGPWVGTLSNNGERIQLSKPGPTPGSWEIVDEVRYASEGNWALRVRETTFGGWDWRTMADGGNRAMELRNRALSNDNGQNWTTSTDPLGGTPGRMNAAQSTNIAPIISAVEHRPAVPRSNQDVTISCDILDESSGVTASVFWRDATTTSPGPFQSIPMVSNGVGRYSAVIAAGQGGLTNLSIVEFYVLASDGVNARTWPAPTNEGQNANCQFQFDDQTDNTTDSYYRLVLTASENAAFNAVSSSSDRQFNMTLVFKRGDETNIRYCSEMRIRGNSSRSYQFRPLRISIPNDTDLDGVTRFNLNPRSSYLQYLGMRLFQAAGVRAFDTLPVELRRNGVEQTTSSGSTPDYGKWVRMEDINSDMVDEHWPNANSGNIYKKGRAASFGDPDGFWRSTQPAPTSPDSLLDGWSKQNNSAANDWSDLRNFFQVWQTAAAPHFPGSPIGDAANIASQGSSSVGNWDGTAFTADELASVETVADLDQWARWFAVMTILQDNETNISNGQDDDYNVYFEPNGSGQRRMHLLPHDLDTVLGLGDNQLQPTARGLYDMTADGDVFRTLLPLIGNSVTTGNATFRTKYHNALRELYATVFDADTTANPYPSFYAFVDNHLSGWAPTSRIDQIKTFATARQAHLLNLIGPGTTPLPPPAATSNATFVSPPGALMIHEVLAVNAGVHTNGGGVPDVIELFNSAATALDLSDLSLTDDPAVPRKFVFPAGTTIAAGGYLTVYADSNTGAPGLHTMFGLDSGGDQVRLYSAPATGQVLLDSIQFGPQVANLSIGRTGVNRDVWRLCTPTIGGVNTAVGALGNPSDVCINEWLSNPGFRFEDDYIELYNRATAPVALGGMSLTDDFINLPTRHVLPPLSFIAPKAFMTFTALGGDAIAGDTTQLPFRIGNTFGWLALVGANGTIVDRVDIVGQPEGGSTARTTDGGPNTAVQTLPVSVGTPGVSNENIPPNVIALLNNLRISELNYFPTGSGDQEFIEFVNIGNTKLDLTGVRISNAVDFVFPPSSLEPNARIIVARSVALMRSLYGNNVNVVGQYSGRLDNTGERLVVQPPTPYDAAILNFKWEATWYAQATGGGRSLEIADLDVFAGDYEREESWMVSAEEGGNPVLAAAPVINGLLTSDTALTVNYNYQITATNHPYVFAANGLPPGLSLNSGTGLISGVPTVPGNYEVEISAANGAGVDTKTLVINVSTQPPPNITSSGAASTIIGDAFSYQITATNGPQSFSASGLPSGLTINAATGLISGSALVPGIYNVLLSATNQGGTGTLMLNLAVASSGPLATYAWSAVSNQETGVPFVVQLRATDAQGRTVTGFNGEVTVGGRGPGTSGGLILITECGSGSIDYWEIQNVGNATMNTAGWFIVPNNASNGGVSVPSPAWLLPPSMAPGEVIAISENSEEYPNPINWASGSDPRNGWCMLCDNTGAVRDIFVWDYTRAELDTVSFNITVAGNTFTGITIPASEWIGNGLANQGSRTVKIRRGSRDDNDSGDWENRGNFNPENNKGLQNPNLTVPFNPPPPPVPVSPTSVTLSNGVWMGQLAVNEVATGMRLVANDAGNRTGESDPFNVVNPPLASITSPGSVTAVINQPISFQLTASAHVDTWGATGLPPGLSVNASTGVISGTPTGLGSTNAGVSATNVTGTGNATLNIVVKADADGDGMADDWESLNGLNPSFAGDAERDLDGDGVSNLQEFLGGTLPNNRGSRFVIVNQEVLSGSVWVTWNSVATRRYRVWTTGNLLQPWSNLTPQPLSGSNGTTVFTDATHPVTGTRFYKIEAIQ